MKKVVGITSQQAAQLLKEHGLNRIERLKKASLLRRFFNQVNNVINLLLLLAAIVSYFTGHAVDSILIVSILVLNGLFGLYQEYKADEAIEFLEKITITKVRVVRDGKEMEMDSRQLVPGDVFYVEEGVKIPADGMIIESKHLEMNDAALTGESVPVVKQGGEEVFAGTIVVRGRGFIKTVSTGMHTKLGQIASSMADVKELKTPLQIKIEKIGHSIGAIGIVLSIAIYFLALYTGSNQSASILLAISLAVSMVPEGLPAVMTITLAIGVREMAKKKAVVRKLSSIEAIGGVTIIATDKTGTLTMNKMEVREAFTDDKLYKEEMPHKSNHPFTMMVLDSVLCSTASLVKIHDHGTYDVLGDPTEGALLVMAEKYHTPYEEIRKEWEMIDEIPFDSITKMMSVIVKKNKEHVTFTKGAPESVLKVSDHVLIGETVTTLTPAHKKTFNKTLDAWAGRGYRVLAFAYKDHKVRGSKTVFLGMVAMYDPPRPEAKEAVYKAHEAGIRVIMITGDNDKTAETIGLQLGIVHEGSEILLGSQIEDFSDNELLNILPKISIIARATPFHKARIVRLLQKQGEIVAVTGDGVNDAIALKQANVGISMGRIGTDVARDASDIVILDDNFVSIVNAVEEGRNITRNLKNAISYLLMTNFTEGFLLLIGLGFGFTGLLIPIQILYINLISDGLPALALAFTPRDAEIMKSKPQTDLELLSKRDFIYVALIGLSGGLIALFANIYFAATNPDLGRAAAFSIIAIMTSFVLIDMWLLHKNIFKNLKKLWSPVFLASFLMPFIFQYLIVTIDGFAHMFKTQSVSNLQYITFVAWASLILPAIAIIKKLVSR